MINGLIKSRSFVHTTQISNRLGSDSKYKIKDNIRMYPYG